jgi:restriction system protein
MDTTGRLLLPLWLREKAHPRCEVAVSGRLKYLEVTPADDLRQEILEPFTDPDSELFLGDLLLEQRRLITPEEFRERVVLVTDRELIELFDNNPEDLYRLTPRQFEELVADLLKRMGYTVNLGPGSKDGGVDVFAERAGDFGPELTLVQCKRNRIDRKVGEPVIKQLSADVSDRRASRGLLVTTSFFTATALEYIDRSRYLLAGADVDQVQRWIARLRRATK